MVEALATIIVVMIGYILYRKKATLAKPKSRQEELIEKNANNLMDIQDSDKVWGIYIDYDNEQLCCKNVLNFEKKHFSKKTAPSLPLKGCDRSLCRCHYVSLPEKRDKTRREHQDRRDEIRFEDDNDRRSGSERRSGIWVHHDE